MTVPDPAAIRFNLGQRSVEIEQQPPLGVLRAVQVDDFGDQLVEVESRDLHGRRARILAERVDHLFHRLYLVNDGGGGTL